MNVRHLASRVGPPAEVRPDAPNRPASAHTPSFAEALRRAEAEITLSAHAERRVQERGISLDTAERGAIAEAMHLLDGKGARDALLLRADAAFVVSVPSRTVVTAVAADELRERAFTQIDSALLL